MTVSFSSTVTIFASCFSLKFDFNSASKKLSQFTLNVPNEKLACTN